MYEFHYDYAKKKWKDLKLFFTDTDSLLYEIGTEDFFADIAEVVLTMYDTSDYKQPPFEGFPIGRNKKVIGLMKDEVAGKQTEEFVGLRPKQYSLEMFSGGDKKKYKGVSKAVVKRKIPFEDYKECLFSRKEQLRDMNVIRSRKHEIFSKTVSKVALSAMTTKDTSWKMELKLLLGTIGEFLKNKRASFRHEMAL